MSDKTNQKQSSGENSQNIQIAGDLILGITEQRAREIALEIYQDNFIKLSKEAADTAKVRVQEFVDEFLIKLNERNPESLDSLKDPGMQYALYSAQKEYAKSGSKDLADVLVDILVDRAKITEKSLKQIVLDESLNVVSKLTNDQLDTLTVSFLLRYSINYAILSIDSLDHYLRTQIEPFVALLSKENSLYQHLEYCGCINVSIGINQLELIFQNNYKGLFSKCFTMDEFNAKVGSDDIYKKYLITCLHNISKYQLDFVNEKTFDDKMKQDRVPDEILTKLSSYFEETTMPPVEIKKFLIGRGKFMQTLFDVWDNSPLRSLTLSSVGIALAQANFRRRTGMPLDLGVWIK